MFSLMNPLMSFILLFVYEILRIGIATDYLLFVQKHSTIKHQREPINIKRQKVGITLYFINAFLSPFLELLWIDYIFRKIDTIVPFLGYDSSLLICILILPILPFSVFSDLSSGLAE